MARPKGAPKPASPGKAASSATANGAADKAVPVVNKTIVEEIAAVYKEIKAHPEFKDIEQKDPLTFAQGATKAPYDAKACEKSLASDHAEFETSINFFWLKDLYMSTPGVPLNEDAHPHRRAI